MSQPVDPYRGGGGAERQRPRYGQQPPYDGSSPHGQQPYDQQPYDQQPYDQQPYDQPAYQPGYGRRPAYDEQPAYERRPQYSPPSYGEPRPQDQPYRPAERPLAPRQPPPAGSGRGLRIPGLGLLLMLAGVVLQVLCLTVLPWVRFGGNGVSADALPEIWRLATDPGAQGFGGWYLLLLSYPLAVLSIVLALASVLESVASKVLWGGLALVGLGVLAVKYGFGPFADLVSSDSGGPRFSTLEMVVATVALVALVVVIFVLRMAVSTFRRIAGLILLGLAGVHITAMWDLVRQSGVDQLGLGAYGSALGYVLVAIAAFVGPRRLPGV